MMSQDDDLLIIDDETSAAHNLHEAWKVLVVDDDEEVHLATTLALRRAIICERGLEFLHAYSAREAETLLRQHTDIAVILLDVVMESEDAGLRLIPKIRQELGLLEARIILRTGQPGHAPELNVIRDYDINDYKTKSELTFSRLITALTAAIRSYEQLHTINASKRGLAMIIEASAALHSEHAMTGFAAGVLTQVCGLLGLPPEGLLCAKADPSTADGPLIVIGAAGAYRELINQPLERLPQPEVVTALQQALSSRQNVYLPNATVLLFAGHGISDAAVYLRTRRPLSEIDRQLLEVFCINISVGFDNINLFQTLEYNAYYDGLTGLFNRSGLLRALDSPALRQQANSCLALIDVHGFSSLNDALGHQKGDQLLKAIARRLHEQAPPDSVVARLNNDVFAVASLCEQQAPEKLLALFEEPFAVDEFLFPLSVHLGLVQISDTRDCSALELLKDANIALNRAKSDHSGRKSCRYTAAMDEETRSRLNLLSELHVALQENRGLSLHYQPQIELHSRRVVGVEALLRWQRDDGQFVPPDRIIPLAEHSGLIIDLGDWIINTALAQLATWRQQGQTSLQMAINVSQAQFRHPGLFDTLQALLQRHAVPADRVELEITESLAMQDADATIAILRRLKTQAFQIAIDDFGTGYSSLAYLQLLPIDRLKIDKAFVRDIEGEAVHASIASTIVHLGLSRNLTVIAEGIETLAQAQRLQAMGCHQGQGYLFAKPMPPAQVEEWLRNWVPAA